MEIITFGTGGRLLAAEGLLSADPRPALYSRLVLLPIPTSRDGEHISGTDIPLTAVADAVSGSTLAVGYAIPDELSALLRAAGAEALDLSLDEEFLTENAILTAKGAFGRILTESAADLSDMKIGLIGYGRIGSSLLRMLLFLGARVTVLTGRREVVLTLAEAGVESCLYAERGDLSRFDLIINTAPASILSENDLAALLPSARIIDLASGNFLPASPAVKKLPSIPELMYPESAGRLYVRAVAKRAFSREVPK